MAKIIVKNSGPLEGTIRVSGAKNAILPILAATLLAEEKCYLEDIPLLKDVVVMSDVLRSLGAEVSQVTNGEMTIYTPEIKSNEAPYDLVQKMRASFYVLGPLLARTGVAKIPMPGGCAIGARPIDLHLKGFTALGAKIEFGHGFVEARAEKLIGASIYLDFPSVGATENIMMAAVLAEGTTIIENAAEEPEIIDLANFLNKIGANVKGAGTDTIRILGVKKLLGANHAPIPDRIEAGTYMIAVAAAGGNVLIENVVPSHLKPIIAKLKECGIDIAEEEDNIRVISDGNIKSVDITTLPYPGFPTDLQAQFMAMLTKSNGVSVVMETVFENRFMHVAELSRMGANIKIEGHSAVVQGKSNLEGAKVKATDLRAGAALIIAGLISEGSTEIVDTYHIDRGYYDIENKLTGIGVNITRVKKII
ncbi:UDP-N-acetylglucosamine 1-carboxyvinyltransferase [Helicovermis profundi]|uniref:UDP-N-acetylglucosamine 1-carboxyvinyltransferase n=1 Tax=Helicovermis profundi TaxID=3065157 RepID=A0AAU9E6W5_9FIRM|nr:UDP-N-acetylglucosamine 1-carboxyvinyltransferase [Clostridia bacterium S502]